MSKADELAARVRRFALRVLNFVKTLPHSREIDGIVRQLARSGPAMSSNYRAARRGRSRAEFIAKLGVVVEEADETEHWLEVLRDADFARGAELDWLLNESHELRAIFVASYRTARSNRDSSSNP